MGTWAGQAASGVGVDRSQHLSKRGSPLQMERASCSAVSRYPIASLLLLPPYQLRPKSCHLSPERLDLVRLLAGSPLQRLDGEERDALLVHRADRLVAVTDVEGGVKILRGRAQVAD